MSIPVMTREAWLAGIKGLIHPVGDCMEWEGPYRGTTPIIYCPESYAWPGNTKGQHSARTVLYSLSAGKRIKHGEIIRPRCWNERCVNEDHFGFLNRKTQVQEQSRRGELSTVKRRTSLILAGRAKSPLDQQKVDAIRLSDETDAVEAEKYGVSREAVRSIRCGDSWPVALPGASVFSWRPRA